MEERRRQEDEVIGIRLPACLYKIKALRDSAVLLSIQQFSLGQRVNLVHSVVGLMSVSHQHTSVIT